MKYSLVFVLIVLISCGDSSQKSTVEKTKQLEISERVNEWNEAHNIKDVGQLSNLYSDKVNYYQTELDKNSVLEKKLSFFKKHPDYKQVILGEIKVESLDEKFVKCSFTKRVTMNGKSTDYPSYLIASPKNATWYISTEGDLVTDQNLLNRSRKSNDIPDQAIKGDYDGDGSYEYMWVESPELNRAGNDCIGGCTSYIRFNDNLIPSISVQMSIDLSLINHGDLNEDGADEIGVLPIWFSSNWKQFKVYSKKNGNWSKVIQFTTFMGNWFEPEYTPLRKHPRNSKQVYIYPANEDPESPNFCESFEKLIELQ